ncbi:MAG: hypothetical protein DMF93_12840 [Acidobacteria bacterium]|nr:MAG: hypothetical protein DMF93_12840 [Acidobacteriota bacterium]
MRSPCPGSSDHGSRLRSPRSITNDFCDSSRKTSCARRSSRASARFGVSEDEAMTDSKSAGFSRMNVASNAVSSASLPQKIFTWPFSAVDGG